MSGWGWLVVQKHQHLLLGRPAWRGLAQPQSPKVHSVAHLPSLPPSFPLFPQQ